MTNLKIARMGHPVLARPALPVQDPTSPRIRRLVEDMMETMKTASGVGLAAPQVGVPLRLVLFHIPAGRRRTEDAEEYGDPTEGVPLTVLINPQIEPLDETVVAAFEACLSIPGMTGLVPRHHRIRYRGVGLDGQEILREAEGFHARVVQHECDHLDGVLYPMRMSDLTTFGFADEIRLRYAPGPDAGG
ncbi:MAG: peptide deformylase [Alphaproteobacteria bacterium]